MALVESQSIQGERLGRTHTPQSKRQQQRASDFWVHSTVVPSRRRYNITICDDPKFIWFRNAKVGTRSTFAALRAAGLKLTAESLFGAYYFPGEYDDYFKFGFVRNPWDRLVSGWLNKIVRRNTLNLDRHTLLELQEFGNFVRFCQSKDLTVWNAHFNYQHTLLDLNELDFLGRYECFAEDLTKVFNELGISIPLVPHKNRRQNRAHYSHFYTGDIPELVHELYRKDVQLFGYRFSQVEDVEK